MKKLMFLLLLLAAQILISGSLKEDAGVIVSFRNRSKEDFVKLKVSILGEEFTFLDIKKGQRTGSIKVPKTYLYCYAEAITAVDTLICQPIDYVGETLYKTGNITMQLYIVPEQGKDRSLDIRND